MFTNTCRQRYHTTNIELEIFHNVWLKLIKFKFTFTMRNNIHIVRFRKLHKTEKN